MENSLMKRFPIPAAVLLGTLTASALAAPGTVLRDEKLYSQPSATASVASRVARGSSVDILAKQGGWLRVNSGKSTGWIRLLSVRAGPGGLGGAGLGDVVGAATTKSDPTRVVAVAGLRGLDNEDLKRARFNADELARLDDWVVTPAQARKFASQSGLVAVDVAALPKPTSNAQSGPAQEPSAWEAN
jgi:hypothetical protein